MLKLNSEKVINLAKQGLNKKEAAEKLNVDYSTLWRFLKSNPEIKNLFPTKLQVEKSRHPGCLSNVTKEELEELAAKKLSYQEIADKLLVSHGTVYRLMKHYKIKHMNGSEAAWKSRRIRDNMKNNMKRRNSK